MPHTFKNCKYLQHLFIHLIFFLSVILLMSTPPPASYSIC